MKRNVISQANNNNNKNNNNNEIEPFVFVVIILQSPACDPQFSDLFSSFFFELFYLY